MAVFQFTLIVTGPDLQSDGVAETVYQAGCDDALVGRTDGVQYLDFDREAPSLETAILSAISDAESIPGVEVIRLAGGGLVSMADIATRTGRTRESVRLLIVNQRGPGGFPPPVTDPRTRYRLWRWSEVQRWFEINYGRVPIRVEDRVAAAVNAGLELRQHVRSMETEQRANLSQLIGL